MSFCHLNVSVQKLLIFENRVIRVVCAFGNHFSRRVLVCCSLQIFFFRHLGMACGLGGISVLHTRVYA